MKKIIGSVLIFSLVLVLAFSLFACENSGYVDYTEYGLSFRLPKEFRKLTVQGVDIHYSTLEADFEVQVLPKSEFEDEEMGYYIDFDMTVKEYTEFFIEENEWGCEYTYDEVRDATNFYFFWTPTEEIPYSYYYMTVMKSDVAFYIIIMSCVEEDYPNYEAKFRAWSTYLSVVE